MGFNIVRNRWGLEKDNRQNLGKAQKQGIVISAEKFQASVSKQDELVRAQEVVDTDLKRIIEQSGSSNPSLMMPITLPFQQSDTVNHTKDLFEINEEEPFLIQFPRVLPFEIASQNIAKQEEMEIEEPVYDSSGFLVKKDFENSFYSIGSNISLGKLRIYKSGKMEMQIGETKFNVNQGVENRFSEDIMLISESKAFELGKLKSKKLIATPSID